MTTRVVHVSDNVPGAIYIGREYRRRGYDFDESPLRNPFRIGKGYPRWGVMLDYRGMVDNRFRMAAQGIDIGIEFVESLMACRDKPIACWCRHDGDRVRPGNACHGDILIEQLVRYSDADLRDLMGEPATGEPTVRSLHDAAMRFCSLGEVRRMHGDSETAKELDRIALPLEERAASMIERTKESEPTRSILYRSAGWIAFHAGDPLKALELAREGLGGFPPGRVYGELIELETEALKAGGAS